MKISAAFGVAIVGAFGLEVAMAGIGDADAAQMISRYHCDACHMTDRKLIGPAFRAVARKYAGDSAAPHNLKWKIRNGGSGAWGAVPMPPNNIPDPDLIALIDWIVALN